MDTIAKTIQAMQRPPHSLTQVDIARMTGLAQSQISKWGAGNVPISARHAVRLLSVANALGINKIKTRRGAK